MTELGRLLDRDALDADDGPRARVKIEVPAAWADEGGLVEVTCPRTLPCARCDGGGCDGCGRSGALRAPAATSARVVRVRVPSPLRDGVAMRIAEPFGRASGIAQLWIEVRPGPASASVRRLGRGGRPRREPRPILKPMVMALSILVVLVAVVLAILTWARC